jgi:hypothetical protein
MMAALTACGVHAADKAEPTQSATTSGAAVDLVNSDIKAFSHIDQDALNTYDASHGGLFSTIYGGTTPRAIKNYLSTRIHYYMTADDLSRFSTNDDGKYTGWANESNVEVGASNIGMGLWLQGLVDGVNVVITDGTQSYNVDNSRFGLMEIGPGYKPSVETNRGSVPLPAAYRQAILLHEARHSDCTGGVTQADLDVLRQSQSMTETEEKYKAKACGHLHSACPSGDYQGLLACDDIVWGAYAVQYIFVDAMDAVATGVDKAILDMTVIDTKSRLQYDVDGMLAGQLGAPDMSSSGLQ